MEGEALGVTGGWAPCRPARGAAAAWKGAPAREGDREGERRESRGGPVRPTGINSQPNLFHLEESI